MKKNMAFKVIQNMLCCVTILLPLKTGLYFSEEQKPFATNTIEIKEEEPVPTQTQIVLLDLNKEYCDINCFIKQNDETITFFSKAFGVNYDDVVANLIAINADTKYNKFNIGQIKNKNGELVEYRSFEEGFIEYLYSFVKNKKGKVNNTRVSYSGNKEYILDLIKYYTSIYNNVDYLTAVSIAAAESGHYSASYMLKCNNIYGGMGSKGLIKYKNIEYGVLSYIRLLSNNYYAKGYDTLEEIGRIYCPSYDSNGNKIASQHWLNLVRKVSVYYEDTPAEVTVSQLI